MLDLETGVEIGNPDKLPFGSAQEIDLIQLQKNVEKRIKFGVASASGIRQIFDDTYGDDATDYEEGTSTEITNAAKIHVATIADEFVRLLQNQTGLSQPTIVVAIDSRHTGPTIADTMIRVLVSHGIHIRYTFITPITEVAVYSRKISAGFIYISSSHNPRGYNGLKLGLNDGRLLPRDLALTFIESYQNTLKDMKNTEAMIHKVDSASPDTIRKVYSEIDRYKSQSREIYARFSDQMITGLKNSAEIANRKKSLKEKIRALRLWIGIDPNGGARKDKEYLESWGFHVLEINGRPQVDMVHELAPVPDACEQAREALINAQREGKNIIAFLVYDTDGDRKNIVIPTGKDKAVIPGVQIIFVLDILCSILDDADQHRNLGIVVNGPTSIVLEQLASYLGFTIKRVEVGEANVATAGEHLHEQGVYVPIMGEGSNGSVFNLDLLVREPLHSVRTLINFITKPELTKTLLSRLHQADKYDDWHSPDKITNLLINIIKSLLPSITTDFFTDEGIRRGGSDLPHDLFKANFDEYFDSQLWHKIAEEIRESFQGEPIAEFVNYEGDNELRGKGNRKTGTGGYKIEFYVRTQEGNKHHIGWIWFRPSGTERGVMRRGVSLSHWDTSNPHAAEIVNRTYKYMDNALTDALNIVEKKTLSNL